MKILTVHNKYLIRGGEDESRESEDRILAERGNQVDEYVEDNLRVTELGKIKTAVRTLWSRESYRAIRFRLRQIRPDIVNVQNFFPLISPAVYYAARAEGVPVVQTLHNFRVLCPGALFFRDGKPCEKCLGKTFALSGVVHGCYRNSRLSTLPIAAMSTLHFLLGTWKRRVSRYIAVSEFARQKFIQAGFSPEQIVAKPNFVSPDPGPGAGSGNYAVFLGRLAPEKGLRTLLAAWGGLQNPIPLKIIGDGPDSPLVQSAAAANPLIEVLGRKPAREAYDIIGEASLLVFPSEWYETFGRVAAEAFAKGTPVIASNLGAMAELVDHGRTGLLFEPGNPQDLAAKVTEFRAYPPERKAEMRRAARAEYEAKYTAERNYQMLMAIYERAIETKRKEGTAFK